MSSIDTVTISHNYWRIPSVERAFVGWLEGKPTEEERKQVIAEAIAARAAWKPTEEAMALVQKLKAFVGCRVKIQLWDTCMWLMDEEGPFPFAADCIDVKVLQEAEFPQAYLLLENVKEIPNKDGYSPEPYFQKRENCNYLHASFADLYQVTKLVNL